MDNAEFDALIDRLRGLQDYVDNDVASTMEAAVKALIMLRAWPIVDDSKLDVLSMRLRRIASLTDGADDDIERECLAAADALTALRAERDEAVSWIRVVGDEVGPPFGDRTVILANVRALRAERESDSSVTAPSAAAAPSR